MDSLKLIGEVAWHDADGTTQAEIRRAFLRDDGTVLVLDFMFGGRPHFLEMTRKDDNRFSGACELSSHEEKWRANASGKLYSHGTEHVLVGFWREGNSYRWVVELQEIEHFPDEAVLG